MRRIKLTSRLQHRIANALPGTFDHIVSKVGVLPGRERHSLLTSFNRMLAYRLAVPSDENGQIIFKLADDVEIEPEPCYDQLYHLPRLFFAVDEVQA